MRALGVALALWACAAWAHPQGFHKKLVITVARSELQALLVMDVDSGERCSLIRAGADSNHDGLLSPDETGALKQRLVAMATRSLKLAISGAPLSLEVKDSKVNLRQDTRVNEAGLSVAMVYELRFSSPLTPGLRLEVEDASPDLSTVILEVFQVPATDAGLGKPFAAEVESGRKTSLRLGALAEHR